MPEHHFFPAGARAKQKSSSSRRSLPPSTTTARCPQPLPRSVFSSNATTPVEQPSSVNTENRTVSVKDKIKRFNTNSNNALLQKPDKRPNDRRSASARYDSANATSQVTSSTQVRPQSTILQPNTEQFENMPRKNRNKPSGARVAQNEMHIPAQSSEYREQLSSSSAARPHMSSAIRLPIAPMIRPPKQRSKANTSSRSLSAVFPANPPAYSTPASIINKDAVSVDQRYTRSDFKRDCKKGRHHVREGHKLLNDGQFAQASNEFQSGLTLMDKVLSIRLSDLPLTPVEHDSCMQLQETVRMERKYALEGFSDSQASMRPPPDIASSGPSNAPPSYTEVLREDLAKSYCMGGLSDNTVLPLSPYETASRLHTSSSSAFSTTTASASTNFNPPSLPDLRSGHTTGSSVAGGFQSNFPLNESSAQLFSLPLYPTSRIPSTTSPSSLLTPSPSSWSSISSNTERPSSVNSSQTSWTVPVETSIGSISNEPPPSTRQSRSQFRFSNDFDKDQLNIIPESESSIPPISTNNVTSSSETSTSLSSSSVAERPSGTGSTWVTFSTPISSKMTGSTKTISNEDDGNNCIDKNKPNTVFKLTNPVSLQSDFVKDLDSSSTDLFDESLTSSIQDVDEDTSLSSACDSSDNSSFQSPPRKPPRTFKYKRISKTKINNNPELVKIEETNDMNTPTILINKNDKLQNDGEDNKNQIQKENKNIVMDPFRFEDPFSESTITNDEMENPFSKSDTLNSSGISLQHSILDKEVSFLNPKDTLDINLTDDLNNNGQFVDDSFKSTSEEPENEKIKNSNATVDLVTKFFADLNFESVKTNKNSSFEETVSTLEPHQLEENNDTSEPDHPKASQNDILIPFNSSLVNSTAYFSSECIIDEFDPLQQDPKVDYQAEVREQDPSPTETFYDASETFCNEGENLQVDEQNSKIHNEQNTNDSERHMQLKSNEYELEPQSDTLFPAESTRDENDEIRYPELDAEEMTKSPVEYDGGVVVGRSSFFKDKDNSENSQSGNMSSSTRETPTITDSYINPPLWLLRLEAVKIYFIQLPNGVVSSPFNKPKLIISADRSSGNHCPALKMELGHRGKVWSAPLESKYTLMLVTEDKTYVFYQEQGNGAVAITPVSTTKATDLGTLHDLLTRNTRFIGLHKSSPPLNIKAPPAVLTVLSKGAAAAIKMTQAVKENTPAVLHGQAAFVRKGSVRAMKKAKTMFIKGLGTSQERNSELIDDPIEYEELPEEYKELQDAVHFLKVAKELKKVNLF